MHDTLCLVGVYHQRDPNNITNIVLARWKRFHEALTTNKRCTKAKSHTLGQSQTKITLQNRLKHG